jgi:hypothetical protein
VPEELERGHMTFQFNYTNSIQEIPSQFNLLKNRAELELTAALLRAAATAFGTSKSDVQHHLKALEKSGSHSFIDRPVGRPRNLDDSEDRALAAYVVWLERCGFLATRIQVEAAVSPLWQSRTPPAGPVGQGWYPRFVKDHPGLQKKGIVRAFDRDHAAFENGDLGNLEHFFSKLSEILELRNLTASQILNADERGIRIGVIRERLEVLVVKSISSLAASALLLRIKKRRSRKTVKPSGLYLNSVAVKQVRESLESSTQKEQEEIRRQKRGIKTLRKQHFK